MTEQLSESLKIKQSFDTVAHTLNKKAQEIGSVADKINSIHNEFHVLTTKFIQYFQDIEHFPAQMREELLSGVNTVCQKVIANVCDQVEKKISGRLDNVLSQNMKEKIQTTQKELDQTLLRFNQEISAVEDSFKSSYRSFTRRNLMYAFIFFFSSVITSISIFAWLQYRFDPVQDKTYQAGIAFQKIWPKLTHGEQKRIWNLAK